jgi:hypothetical protein
MSTCCICGENEATHQSLEFEDFCDSCWEFVQEYEKPQKPLSDEE